MVEWNVPFLKIALKDHSATYFFIVCCHKFTLLIVQNFKFILFIIWFQYAFILEVAQKWSSTFKLLIDNKKIDNDITN